MARSGWGARGAHPFDLPSDELAVRLKDTLAIRMPRGDAIDTVRKSLAALVAQQFDSHAEDGSLTELDAVSLSDVIMLDTVKSKRGWADEFGEKVILDEAVKWASVPGRSVDIINLVMPLVRFPLVPMFKRSDELNSLMERSPVVEALVKEALNLQLKKIEPHRVAKHKLIEGTLPPPDSDDSDDEGVEVPRAKRRKYCTEDKVPEANAETFI